MLTLPPTLEQVAQLQAELLQAVNGGASKLKSVLPADVLVSIFRAAEAILRTEASLVELSLDNNPEVFVFGDTHGHFPDVAHMLNQLGYPSASRIYIFNGDYVDRGSWGVELLAVLCALKVAAPDCVYLLRGNHESSTCTKYYGYSQELRAKYERQSKDVYTASKKLFTALPLAALVQKNTLIMHGGLFRRPPEPKRGAKRRKPNHPGRTGAAAAGLVPGNLDDLRKATKGGMDPDGSGTSLLATDVLWSDPVAAPGFAENDVRGVGLTFGPDVTEAFLTANGLRLIIRSHEGPDARDKRSDLPQVLQGYSVDHDTPAGQLLTVFSAPDYPQFQVVEADEDGGAGHRYENLAAVAVLSAPDYATPNMRTFEAVKPRPKADAYYDYAAFCDSDTEVPAGSEAATISNGPSEAASELEPDAGDEVVGPSAPEPGAQAEAEDALGRMTAGRVAADAGVPATPVTEVLPEVLMQPRTGQGLDASEGTGGGESVHAAGVEGCSGRTKDSAPAVDGRAQACHMEVEAMAAAAAVHESSRSVEVKDGNGGGEEPGGPLPASEQQQQQQQLGREDGTAAEGVTATGLADPMCCGQASP